MSEEDPLFEYEAVTQRIKALAGALAALPWETPVPSPRTLATRLKISEAIEATIHGAYPALATKYSNTTKVVFEPLADCATFSPRNATAVSRGPLKGASTAVVIIDENPNCNDDDLLTSKSDVATREEAALLGRNPRAPKIEKTKKKKKTK